MGKMPVLYFITGNCQGHDDDIVFKPDFPCYITYQTSLLPGEGSGFQVKVEV